MDYSEKDKLTAQQLRIIFAVYMQGWNDAMDSLRMAQNKQKNSLESTLKWLNEVPAP